MYAIEYYVTSRGHRPVKEWIDGLDQRLQSLIDTKTKRLAQYGLELVKTDMVKTILGEDRSLYELRCGQCRIAFYDDRRRGTFVLLHGWLKKKRKHERDIEHARRLLRDYLATSERKNHV